LKQYYDEIFKDNILKIVVSNPLKDGQFKKIVIDKKLNNYLVSKYTEKQVFNESISENNLECKLEEYFSTFKQINFLAKLLNIC